MVKYVQTIFFLNTFVLATFVLVKMKIDLPFDNGSLKIQFGNHLGDAGRIMNNQNQNIL